MMQAATEAESTFRRHLEAVLLMILSAGLLVQMELTLFTSS
jgi:hypothetical protein